MEGKQNEKMKELETVLFDFIKKETETPSGGGVTQIVPQMVHELIELWESPNFCC